MGYFSNMAVDMRDDENHSYPSPERQLLWRLDDLKDRLSELVTTGGPYRSGYIYTEDVYEAEETDSTEEIVSEFETEDGFEQIALIDTILPVVLSQNKLAA